MEKALGIDLGGSHVTAVALDAAGCILARAGLVVESHDFDSVFPLITSCLDYVMQASPGMMVLGLGIPGNVNPRDGTTRYLPSFPWGRVEIAVLFEQKYGLPVTMHNDGRCAAIAESRIGSGKDSRVFTLLTLGTGLGGALIIDGQLFDGASFDAGDFGHYVIRSGEDGFPCVCGKRGCFEKHASAQGLVHHYLEAGGTANGGAPTNAAPGSIPSELKPAILIVKLAPGVYPASIGSVIDKVHAMVLGSHGPEYMRTLRITVNRNDLQVAMRLLSTNRSVQYVVPEELLGVAGSHR
jgi:glucokinase